MLTKVKLCHDKYYLKYLRISQNILIINYCYKTVITIRTSSEEILLEIRLQTVNDEPLRGIIVSTGF